MRAVTSPPAPLCGSHAVQYGSLSILVRGSEGLTAGCFHVGVAMCIPVGHDGGVSRLKYYIVA